MEKNLAIFEEFKIRRIYNEEKEIWYFSVIDIIQVLTDQQDYQKARNYWKVLKNRLLKEGSQTVTNCNRLKLVAEDGKMRETDVADPETLLRLIQSVPSPKAEPIKLWLAKVGYERMKEMGIKDLNEVHHLYKYRYFDCNNYHIKTVLDNEFYFATKEELNDPFDLSLRPRYENGSIEQIRKHYNLVIDSDIKIDANEKKQRKELIDRKLKNNPVELRDSLIRNFEEHIKNFRVCSFSGNKWDDILMWAHYCNSHTGFCVGINWKKLSKYLLNNSNNIIPWVVTYETEYPLPDPFMDVESDEAYQQIFSYKFDIWSYEDEVRLIMKNSKDRTFKIPEYFIDEIYIGLRISDVNKTLIVNALKFKEHKPKLYQIIQKNKSFEFDRQEIFYQ